MRSSKQLCASYNRQEQALFASRVRALNNTVAMGCRSFAVAYDTLLSSEAYFLLSSSIDRVVLQWS